MAKKSPALAAFLNFILLGGGYIYVGKRVGFGTGLVVADVIFLATITFNQNIDLLFQFPIIYLYLKAITILLTYDGYKTAQEVNEKITS